MGERGEGRIFVAIPSYRDVECQHTVADIFAKAAQPERVFVGICWQAAPEDLGCFERPCTRPAQLRDVRFHPTESKGMNWARAQALMLSQGEDYVLQIDSHMRFEPGWDATLIDMLLRVRERDAAITAFLPAYEPPDDCYKGGSQVTRIRVTGFSSATHAAFLHVGGDFIKREDSRNGLYPTPLMVGNFLFGPAAMFQRVPVDPHIFFNGDEITYSARLWTHGYTLYQPDRPVAYHRWVHGLASHALDYKRPDHGRVQFSRGRVRHLLRLEHTDDESVLTELHRFGHGEARPLNRFWQYAGIDPDARTLTDGATKGHWNLAMLE